VFDLGRALALLWALSAAWRARGWREAILLAACSYVFALEVASGIAVRDEGPLMPVLSLVLVFLGPSGMPRGHLPAWPLGDVVRHWPATVNAAVGAVVGYVCWRRHARSRASNEYAADYRSSTRLELALLLIAVFEGVYAVARALPSVAADGL
jgi:hypothetical protein